MPEPVVWWHSPGWIGILLALTALLAATSVMIKMMFPKINRTQERSDSMELARRIASSPQRVVKTKLYPGSGRLELTLRADNDDMEKFGLLFAPKHPDSDLLTQIDGLRVLHFDFQELPLKNVEKQDATAYLRVKQ